jgi:hypothetical protein
MPKKKREYKIIRISLLAYKKLKKLADKEGTTLLSKVNEICKTL